MNLALFDLDNTLLAGDSDFEWAQFLIEEGVLDREVYEARNQHFYDQYKAGTLDIREFVPSLGQYGRGITYPERLNQTVVDALGEASHG